MSSAVPSPAPARAPEPSRAEEAPRRRVRPWLVIGAIAIGAAFLGLLIAGTAAQSGAVLGADNPAPAGSQALVSVLRDHGVTVRPVATLEEARAAAGDPADTTVALYDPDGHLRGSRLERALGLGARIVFVAPDAAQSSAAAQTAGRVTVIPAAAALENGHILDGANAGGAVRALGASRTLLWYLPSPADVGTGGASGIADAVPGWVTPVLLLGAIVAVAAAVWRGRRFGALVVEPLPVIVRSRESMEGRARLYERSGARLHALDALRIGAIGRLTGILGLPASADAAAVSDAAASAVGAATGPVRALLLDAVPGSDAELVELSDGLAVLEREVRDALHRPSRGTGTRTEE